MPIRPELLLRDAAGIPLPPDDLAKRIHQRIGPDWNLRYLSVSWAVCRDWPPNDRRWLGVRTGEHDPAFAWDIIGHLPLSCSVDEAPAFLEQMLRVDSRDDIQKKALAIADWNVIEQPKAMVEDVIHATRDEMGKHDEVESAIFAVTPAKKVTKRRPKFQTIVGGPSGGASGGQAA